MDVPASPSTSTGRWALWLPLVLFALFVALVMAGLVRPADRAVKSAMIGKSLPAFSLPALVPSKAGLTTQDFGGGEPRLLNIFASWCVPCVTEAPVLLQLKDAGVRIDGIAVRDSAADMAEFLARNGDAFERIGSDTESRVQLAMGSAGVPESFVIDGRGKIVLQHVGAIKPDDVAAIIDAVSKAR